MAKPKIFVERKFIDYIDLKLLIPVIAVTIIGLISIYSATAETLMSNEFTNQLISFFVALVSMIFFMFIDEKRLRPLSIVIYTITLVGLVLVLLIGSEVYGTRGWLSIGGRSFQPAEFAKLAIILLYGFIFSNINVSLVHIRVLTTTLGITLLPLMLILLQPDVGTATVIIATFIGMIYWTGANLLLIFLIVSTPLILIFSLKGTTEMILAVSLFSIVTMFFKSKFYTKIIIILLATTIALSAPMVFEKLAPHQKARIKNFLDPESADKLASGYNVTQSVLAVGSGGILGKGFMQGTQTQLRYIPKQWTDFIFSVPAEEFGLWGSLLILVLYYIILNRLIYISIVTKSRYFSVIIFSSFTLFLYHIIINIGMVLGLTPVMGIPLPFMSYGGSAMIVNYSLIGIALNAYRRFKY